MQEINPFRPKHSVATVKPNEKLTKQSSTKRHEGTSEHQSKDREQSRQEGSGRTWSQMRKGKKIEQGPDFRI